MLIERKDFIERLRNAARGVAAGVPHALFAIHLEPYARAADECGAQGASALEQVVVGAIQMQIGPSLCVAQVSGEEFALRLLDEFRIAVMPGESFGTAASGHVRIALTVEDSRLLAALGTLADLYDRLAQAAA